MINLVYTPQRSGVKAEYIINNDTLTVKIGDRSELFDFTGLPEGQAEEITAEALPINPVVAVDKAGETVNITVIRFYGEEEKDLFEVMHHA